MTLSGLEDLSGCWRVTSAHGEDDEQEGQDEDFRFRAFVLDISEDGELRSVWFELELVETSEVGYLEVVRFFEANTGIVGADLAK